jgi:chorismate dehydratase
MPATIRVGAVNYLNTKPLIERLSDFAPHDRPVPRPAEPPRRPARRGRYRRRADPGGRILPRAESTTRSSPTSRIGSRGPVLSVTLFSRVPWHRTSSRVPRRGLADECAALTQVCCGSGTAVRPRFEPLPIDAPADDLDYRRRAAHRRPGDAGLPAGLPLRLRPRAASGPTGPGCRSCTLCGPSGAGSSSATRSRRSTRRRRRGSPNGRGNRGQREAAGLGLDAGFCRRYLETVIHYDLGPRELAGMARFRDLAAEFGPRSEGERAMPPPRSTASCRKPLTAAG